MSDPLSKSQIERLGVRLVRADAPSAEDLTLLHELLLVRSDVLDGAVARVRDRLGVAPTSRIKNTGTIVEKLRRNGGAGLKSMQDLAGMRVVGGFDRRGQDELVARIVELFAADSRAPKVVDRRAAPMHGYSAVHVIVFQGAVPVEIQVRTVWQHEWAEVFEKLADLVGRGIRYGEPPARWWDPEDVDAVHHAYFTAEYGFREHTVGWALTLAEMIRLVEVGEVAAPKDPELRSYRQSVEDALAELRQALRDHDHVDELLSPGSG